MYVIQALGDFSGNKAKQYLTNDKNYPWRFPQYEHGVRVLTNPRKFRSKETVEKMIKRLIEQDKKDAKDWKMPYKYNRIVYTAHKLKTKSKMVTYLTVE